jgi:hypothetical protein
MVTAVLLDFDGAGLLATGLASFMSPVIAVLLAFGPFVVVFGLLLLAIHRKGRGGEAIDLGASFGSGAMHRAGAWRLALGGSVMSALLAIYVGIGAGICVAAGTGAFAVSSVVLASHSD